ncbi:MAG: MFS transporter [Candidatus Bathyarchaeia archaeon]
MKVRKGAMTGLGRLALGIKPRLKGNIRALTIRQLLLTVIAGLCGGLQSLFVKEVLGADAVVLGTLSSIWSAVFLIFILIGGWISDHYDQKVMLLIGTALTVPNPLMFAIAPNWHMIVIANVLGALGAALTSPAYMALLFFSSEQKSRSRSIALINTLTSLTNIFVPPLGATAIQVMGGLNEIRRMFLIQFFLSIGVWIYTQSALKSNHVTKRPQPNSLTAAVRGILVQMKRIYSLSKKRKATPWLFLSSTGPWSWGVIAPFWVIYAAEVCGSSLTILGFLPAVNSLTAALLLLPLANISDRKGRKKVILLTRPFHYICISSLILGGTFRVPWAPFIPLLAWIFRAIGQASSPSWTAASTEVIPEEFQSEWEATRDFLYYLMAIPASIVGGLLWNIDPRLPFLFTLLVDGLVRFPVLIYMIPETVIVHRRPKPLGPHIVLYGLPSSGQTSIARLIQREMSAEIVDESIIQKGSSRDLQVSLPFEKDDEKVIEKKISELLTQKRETVIMEGKPALFAAKAKDKTTRILLVASKEERVRRASNKLKAPEFVVLKELEDKDREVLKITRRLYGVDISKLPPFDVAIDTERVSPEKIAKIIEILRGNSEVEKEEVPAS